MSISAPPKVGKHSFALSIHYNLPFLKNWFRGRHRCLLALCRLYIYQCKSVLFCFCIFLSRPCFTSKICFVMAHVWTFLLLFLLSHPEYALLWLMFGLSTPFTFSTSRICCVMNMFWVFSYIFTFYVSEAYICSTAHRIIVFLSSKKFANFFYFSKKLVDKCHVPVYNYQCCETTSHKHRSVAQFGRALRSGRRGRRFKSCHFDFFIALNRLLRPHQQVIRPVLNRCHFPKLPKSQMRSNYHEKFARHRRTRFLYITVSISLYH